MNGQYRSKQNESASQRPIQLDYPREEAEEKAGGVPSGESDRNRSVSELLSLRIETVPRKYSLFSFYVFTGRQSASINNKYALQVCSSPDNVTSVWASLAVISAPEREAAAWKVIAFLPLEKQDILRRTALRMTSADRSRSTRHGSATAAISASRSAGRSSMGPRIAISRKTSSLSVMSSFRARSTATVQLRAAFTSAAGITAIGARGDRQGGGGSPQEVR